MAFGEAASRERPRRRPGRTLLVVAGLGALALAPLGAQRDDDKDDKKDKGRPRVSLSLKANPPISFSPARIVVSAELKGPVGDDGELYCPRLEWDWGDGTRSEANVDCEPFEPGKSTIQRRWTATHTYDTAGNYRVQLRLRRGDRFVLGGNTTVQVRPGVRDLSNGF